VNAYERIAIGDTHVFGSKTFTADSIKRFAEKYDPQAFHLDETAAKQSGFGRLCASGWHTASAMMRLLVDYFDSVEARARAAGEPYLVSGPSPGFDDLRWPHPVYAGDTVTYTARIVAKRPSRSRPGWGLLSMTTTGVNQYGRQVFSVTTHVFVETGR
jgi:acyl dehydratase